MNRKQVRGVIVLGLLSAGCSMTTLNTAPPKSTEAAKSLPERVEGAADVWSSDGRLHVNNVFNDGGGTLADYTITFIWKDGNTETRWVRGSAEDGQGG